MRTLYTKPKKVVSVHTMVLSFPNQAYIHHESANPPLYAYGNTTRESAVFLQKLFVETLIIRRRTALTIYVQHLFRHLHMIMVSVSHGSGTEWLDCCTQWLTVYMKAKRSLMAIDLSIYANIRPTSSKCRHLATGSTQEYRVCIPLAWYTEWL